MATTFEVVSLECRSSAEADLSFEAQRERVDQSRHYLNRYGTQETASQSPLETLLRAHDTLDDLLKVYENDRHL